MGKPKHLHRRPSSHPTGIVKRSDTEVIHLPHVHLVAVTQVVAKPSPASPTLAIVQAAATGNISWLWKLLQTFNGDVTDAVAAAASNGHYNCVALLQGYLSRFNAPKARQIMREGVAPATAKGHIGIVLFLLKGVAPGNAVDYDAVWIAFLEAAANGFVEILELAASYLSPRDANFELNVARAMSNAVSGGFIDVVVFLLTWEKWDTDFAKIFEKAMATEQHAVAKKIYEIYPQVKVGGNLLVDMAASGRLDAVKYLYDRGHKDPNLLVRAFQHAAANKATRVATFLRAAIAGIFGNFA